MSKEMTNREFAEKDRNFQKACEAAGIPPTKRQASKYLRGIGLTQKIKREGRK